MHCQVGGNFVCIARLVDQVGFTAEIKFTFPLATLMRNLFEKRRQIFFIGSCFNCRVEQLQPALWWEQMVVHLCFAYTYIISV